MENQFKLRRQVYAGYQGKDNPTEKERIVHLLQMYHSTEGFNASFLTRWIEATSNQSVKGGLRMVQAREAIHARLMRERLKELGETTFVEVSEERRINEVPFFASKERGDVEKLALLVSLFNDVDYFMEPLTTLVDEIQEDLQSKELLRMILDNEYASVKWFAKMHQQLSAAAIKE